MHHHLLSIKATNRNAHINTYEHISVMGYIHNLSKCTPINYWEKKPRWTIKHKLKIGQNQTFDRIVHIQNNINLPYLKEEETSRIYQDVITPSKYQQNSGEN